MGPHRRDAAIGGGRALTRIARVVPDVPSFNVDDGFRYVVPDAIGNVRCGSIVRVPLGGRRVRGWVTSLEERAEDGGGLRELLAVSGDAPIFDDKLLEILRWVALHYAAPLATVLPRSGPPNLPRGDRGQREGAPVPSGPRTSMLTGSGPWRDEIASHATAELERGGMVLVVAPSVREVDETAAGLERVLGDVVQRASSSRPASEMTRVWRRAGRPGVVVVGTRETALWHLPLLGRAILVEPGRRALKAKQMPTVHVRDVLRRRSQVERFSLLALGPVPPTEFVAAGVRIDPPAGRSWPLVEIVGRDEEPPGSGLVLDRSRSAVHGIVSGGGSVFVHVPRRGHTLICVGCGTVRRCPACGAGGTGETACPRCDTALGACGQCGGGRFRALGVAVGTVVEDLRRSLGDRVGVAGSGVAVEVGTERDLPPPGSVDLAVAAEPDALWLEPHYRAEEEALRILARVAGTVRRGRGRRCLVQTSDRHHRVVAALRGGDARALVAQMVDERSAAGLPPGGALIAVEVRGAPDTLDGELRDVVGDDGEVRGPARSGEAQRWLLQGRALRQSRVRLRPAVQAWRDRGYWVRVDADPIDL